MSTQLPKNAALQYDLSRIRAIIQSYKADLTTASPFEKADFELFISYFEDAEKTKYNEIELYQLTHGGIDALKLACAHPERYITNAPPPPITIGDRTPQRTRLTREERIENKKMDLEAKLQKAEARILELKKAIHDWYLHALPEWDKATATAKARRIKNPLLAIKQNGQTEPHYEHMHGVPSPAEDATTAAPTPPPAAPAPTAGIAQLDNEPTAQPESTSARNVRMYAKFERLRAVARKRGDKLSFAKGGEAIFKSEEFPGIVADTITRILKKKPK